MENLIEMKIVPKHELFYNESSNYGIYACDPNQPELIKLNAYKNITIKGNTVRLNLEQEYNAKLIEKEDKRYGAYYEIVSIYEDIPSDITEQRLYLMALLTKNQVDAIYSAYPNQNIVELIKNNQLDISKIKGVGEKTYRKIKDKIIENIEFQKAYEFLEQYNVTSQLIIKLVKHFKSATLLIQKMQDNPYCITEVSGVGFKKADTIALNMGLDKQSKFRILAAIEFVVEDESNQGHTYIEKDNLVQKVRKIIQTDEYDYVEHSLIESQIKDTSKIIVVGNRVALKRNYNAEKYIAKHLKRLLQNNIELDFNVDEFIKEQEERFKITLTDEQKQFYYNIKKYRVNILAGYSGTGKSYNVQLLITLLDRLKISYRLLSPTGKAAKVLANYTNKETETIHRAIGLGLNQDEFIDKVIREEFVIVDETSMVDVQLCEKLLRKCVNENIRILFIGDPAQLVAVSSGNLLHDMINSKIIPLTQLTIVFRQEEGGALDIITRIRQNEKFVNNDFWGIKEFGDNCVVACVPQEKIAGGYNYYFNEYLKQFSSNDITVATPTKKGKLGTVEINNHIQHIVNPKSGNKKEKETGFDKIVFRVGDLVLNTKNSYRIDDIYGKPVDIVNGDIGKIIDIDFENKEIIVDFEFAKVPFEFNKASQLLHCWAMTTHKLQGSSNKVIIVIADKSHKFQLNANLLYTACSRTTDKLVILSQAETINYAMRKKANLQRNTFLEELLINDR